MYTAAAAAALLILLGDKCCVGSVIRERVTGEIK
jgi:hypothetical protein